MPNKLVIGLMRQLLGATQYLHDLEIIHRNIRCQNLLLSSLEPPEIKVTSFEFACFGNKLDCPIMIGSQAPEVWECRYRDSVSPDVWARILDSKGLVSSRSRPVCGKKVDIWSAGAVCSELALRKFPSFLGASSNIDDQAAVYVELVYNETLPKDYNSWARKLGLTSKSISAGMRAILPTLLNLDSEVRISAADFFLRFAEDLNHLPHAPCAKKCRQRGQGVRGED